jgi:F-type H+-transporting ATPase subunit delta
MIERTIARRYASALLALADQGKQVEAVEAAILGVADTFRKDAGFRRMLTHPLIPAKNKQEFLKQVAAGVPRLLEEFLNKLVESGRIGFLPEIAEVFDDLADQYAGVVRMTVESASPLTDAQRAKLAAKLGAVAKGRKVELESKVDPALLGGVRLRVRDTVIDGSVASRLKALREQLSSSMR